MQRTYICMWCSDLNIYSCTKVMATSRLWSNIHNVHITYFVNVLCFCFWKNIMYLAQIGNFTKIWKHWTHKTVKEESWLHSLACSRVVSTKGLLISKAIYGQLTFPQKRTDEFVLFAFLLFTANKSNSSVRFLGESTACQSAFRF